jgi:hypothetical protein
MNPYHFLYSLFYSLSRKTNGNTNNPMYYACLGISTIIPLNLVAIILLIDIVFQIDLMSYMPDLPLYLVAFIYLLLLFFNYLYFHFMSIKGKIIFYEGGFFRGKYVAANTIAVVYIIFSLMLLYVLAAIGFNAKHGS